jgi:hypothetical protein
LLNDLLHHTLLLDVLGTALKFLESESPLLELDPSGLDNADESVILVRDDSESGVNLIPADSQVIDFLISVIEERLKLTDSSLVALDLFTSNGDQDFLDDFGDSNCKILLAFSDSFANDRLTKSIRVGGIMIRGRRDSNRLGSSKRLLDVRRASIRSIGKIGAVRS